MTYKQTVSRLGVCFLFLMLVTGILQTVASVAVSMLCLLYTSRCV